MAAATSVPISRKSEEAFVEYYTQVQNLQNSSRENMRYRFEKVDKAYQREVDKTKEHQRAKRANNLGDTDRFQNITVPVVAPQVEAAVGYQTSVFLTGVPLFGVVADPAFMDAAMQLETKVDSDAIRGGWVREFMKHFRDGFKYNFAPLEVSWEQQKTVAIETDLAVNAREGVPKEILWSGNRVKRLDPYNTFVDPRVDPSDVYRFGEFAGYTEYMNRVQLKSFIAELPDKLTRNIAPAFESSSANVSSVDISSFNFFIPNINPELNIRDDYAKGTNWLAWAGLASSQRRINYKDNYEVTTIYCRVMPSEFALAGLPGQNTPQVFKLIIVNHEHIIYCERQTNAHQWIPILVGQPHEDGLGYQTKSLATNAQPFQEVASAYMNSIMHSRRRAVTDRVLYDPSRITAAHINSDNPSAKIPVRPAAYGKNIGDSVYQFPYREDQAASSMQQIQQLLGLANHLSGQNQASQGQFVKGNKTLHEFESVMQNANNRDQMAAILIEAQVFIPLKHIIKQNVLQYEGGTTLYNRERKREVEIDPITLRKAVLEFKVSDGLVPSSKLMNADTFAVALQQIGSSPQIGSGYNLAPMFSYLMKTQGADLSAFEKSPEQVAYEQAVNSWQQMVAVAIENGIQPEKLPPQPKPAEFGYAPRQATPGNKEAVEGEFTSSQTEGVEEVTEPEGETY